MALKMKDKEQVNKEIQRMRGNFEKALVYTLEALVERLINHAKMSAEYQDQTGNLKSSIGGVLLRDRKPIVYNGFDVVLQGTEGMQNGEAFIDSLIPTMPGGYVLLIVAGMDYASYVQGVHGLNVLASTFLKLNMDLPQVLQAIKNEMQ